MGLLSRLANPQLLAVIATAPAGEVYARLGAQALLLQRSTLTVARTSTAGLDSQGPLAADAGLGTGAVNSGLARLAATAERVQRT